MDSREHDPKPEETQAQPETGIDRDPSANTAPPSNPPIDHEALEKGKENINSVVSW